MNVYIKTVTTKGLVDVAYGGLVSSTGRRSESGAYEENNVVTVNFAVGNGVLCLDGFVELTVDEYKENLSNLKEYLKEKVVANF